MKQYLTSFLAIFPWSLPLPIPSVVLNDLWKTIKHLILPTFKHPHSLHCSAGYNRRKAQVILKTGSLLRWNRPPSPGKRWGAKKIKTHHKTVISIQVRSRDWNCHVKIKSGPSQNKFLVRNTFITFSRGGCFMGWYFGMSGVTCEVDPFFYHQKVFAYVILYWGPKPNHNDSDPS